MRAMRTMVPSIRRAAPGWVLLLGCAMAGVAAAPAPAQVPVCTDCHDVDPAAFEKTVHGAAGIACTDCHTGAAVSHEDKGVPPVDCASCHQDVVDELKTSPHGQGAFTRISGKPACQTCHGPVHQLVRRDDPASQVNRRQVPDTCGACHAGVDKAFKASVHGEAAAHGVKEAPVCTDCHGEHRILAVTDPGSPVFATNLPTMTCGRCHGDLRVTEKFNLPKNVVPSFEDSFHGLSSRAGNKTVANCASCHGVHLILPSADPRSTVNKANLAKTCGKCHPGAGTRFAIGPVHFLRTEEKQTAVFWIRRIYLWLIWSVIGGMVLHNLLDLRRKVLSPVQRPMIPVKERPPRMSRGFRVAHGLVMTSFIVLAYSGFALTYPGAWWAEPLVHWEETIALRGWVHRVAAVVLVLSLGVHVVHLVISRRARACMRRMWPTLEDWHEFVERMKWYLGRRKDMPVSGVLGYPEKAEYLALIWGLLVMALTGFLLWFENFTLHWFPKWVIDVSTTVHFYEAVLATLAILVWHFYFVWLNGKEAPGRLLERRESVVEALTPGPSPASGRGEQGSQEPSSTE